MEPKDLKNSKELKSPEKKDLKKSVKETAVEKETVVTPEETVSETTPVVEETVETKKEVEETDESVVEKEPEKERAETVPEMSSVVEDTVEKEDTVDEPESKTEKSAAKKKTAKKEIQAEEAEVKTEEIISKEAEKVQAETVEGSSQRVEDKTEEEKPAQKHSTKEKKEEKTAKEAIVEAEKTKKETVATAEEEKSTDKEKETEVEKAVPIEEKKKTSIDYTKLTQIELVNTFRDVLGQSDEHDIKNEVEAIKAAFYKNMKDNDEAALKQFIEQGGAEADFVAEEDPYENDIKDLLKEYRQIRIDHNKKLEHEKEENLQRKYEVIEKIKGLINTEESINKTFNEFRELQQEWRDIGLVPQSKMKDLWDLYHFHVENFYDYIKINRELRDLDLKKNLEAKIKLCERAEELLLDSSIIRAFNTLQKYHEQWREIGPVPREQKDDIWERFKAATTKINKKHQEFFENRKTEQKENLEAKTALCEKVEEINEKEKESHKDWDHFSKEIIELQKVWRTIGFAPRKDNNKIYERFRNACDKFFDGKREFYSKNKEEQLNNLQLKIDLCVQAETLKDSTDWKKTTQDFVDIQKKWKEIGPVPRKQSDAIWKRFRTACDYFFDKKSEHFSDVDSEQVDNLKLKEELIKDIKAFKSSDDGEKNLDKLKEFQRRWSEIGHVPYKKKEEIQIQFRESINKLYDDLNLDEEKRNILKFRTKMSSFSESSKGQNKMRLERDKYMNKMKQLENDLVTLENNIGFFANSKNAESLIADVNKKIEVTKQKIELLKEKIRVIDDIEASEE